MRGRGAQARRQRGPVLRAGHAHPAVPLPTAAAVNFPSARPARRPEPRHGSSPVLPEQQGDAAALQLQRVDQRGHWVASAPLLLQGGGESWCAGGVHDDLSTGHAPPPCPRPRLRSPRLPSPHMTGSVPRTLHLPQAQWAALQRQPSGQRRAPHLDHARQVAPVHAGGHCLAHSVQRSVHSVQIVLYQGGLRPCRAREPPCFNHVRPHPRRSGPRSDFQRRKRWLMGTPADGRGHAAVRRCTRPAG